MFQDFSNNRGRFFVKMILFLGISALIANHTASAVAENSIFKPYTKVTLENGLTVIIKEVHSSPIAAIDIRVATGAKNDPPGEAGISHFFEHMLFKGTEHRKVGEIVREVQAVGGNLNAETSLDITHYYVVVPSEYIDLALDVEADAIQHSSFDPSEIDRERNVILEEIKIRQDNPQSALGDLIIQKLFAGTLYANNLPGTPDTIKNINRDTFLAYYHKYYVPNNMTVAVVGDVNTNKILNQLKELFKDFKSQKIEPTRAVKLPKLQEITRYELQKEVRQTYLYFGFPAPPLRSKDSAALGVLRVLLGGCKSAKLNPLYSERLIRSISAEYITFRDAGLFGIYAETQNAALLEQRVQAILGQIIENGITDNELALAKAVLRTGYALNAESDYALAYLMSSFEVDGSIADGEAYEQSLQEVTKEDIQQVAREYINPERYTLVTLKPGEVK